MLFRSYREGIGGEENSVQNSALPAEGCEGTARIRLSPHSSSAVIASLIPSVQGDQQIAGIKVTDCAS